jgi:hypothetical protein
MLELLETLEIQALLVQQVEQGQTERMATLELLETLEIQDLLVQQVEQDQMG